MVAFRAPCGHGGAAGPTHRPRWSRGEPRGDGHGPGDAFRDRNGNRAGHPRPRGKGQRPPFPQHPGHGQAGLRRRRRERATNAHRALSRLPRARCRRLHESAAQGDRSVGEGRLLERDSRQYRVAVSGRRARDRARRRDRRPLAVVAPPPETPANPSTDSTRATLALRDAGSRRQLWQTAGVGRRAWASCVLLGVALAAAACGLRGFERGAVGVVSCRKRTLPVLRQLHLRRRAVVPVESMCRPGRRRRGGTGSGGLGVDAGGGATSGAGGTSATAAAAARAGSGAGSGSGGGTGSGGASGSAGRPGRRWPGYGRRWSSGAGGPGGQRRGHVRRPSGSGGAAGMGGGGAGGGGGRRDGHGGKMIGHVTEFPLPNAMSHPNGHHGRTRRQRLVHREHAGTGSIASPRPAS